MASDLAGDVDIGMGGCESAERDEKITFERGQEERMGKNGKGSYSA